MFQIKKEARESLIRGVDKVADAVRLTLGPRGRYAAIYRGFGPPDITKDGVTVAREIKVTDPMEKIGAELIKEAAVKTNDIAGDGTTTATILTQEFIKNLLNSDVHPTILREGSEACLKEIIGRLKNHAKRINGSLNMIEWVATTSANNDKTIGKLIRDAVEKVGEDGILLVGNSNNAESSIEKLEGMRFDVGFTSPYFITNIEKQTVEYENPLLLITDAKIENVQELVPIIDYAHGQDRPLIIVAEDFETTCLSTLLRNKVSGNYKIATMKMPGFGDFKKENLLDLATFTGGTVITKDVGLKLTSAKPAYLGTCGSMLMTSNKTTFLDGAGDKEAMKDLYTAVSMQKPVENAYNEGRHAERLARLSGKVAVIKVGAVTESELKERRDRVEDAVNAVRAALEDGVVPGGGIALLKIGSTFTEARKEWIPLLKTLPAIFETIVDSTIIPMEEATENVFEGDFWYGFDAKELFYMDWSSEFCTAPILDTVKSIKIALETAVSIATSILMTEIVINAESRRDQVTPVPFG